MLGNYLTTALRHLWRERGYAAINLFGLAVGLALCLLVIQLAAYQLSVGDFHESRDRIYRILGTTFWDKDRYTFATPVQLGPALEDLLPEVEEAVRFTASRSTLLRAGTREGISERVLTADPGVLRVFGFPLLRGTPETALERPYTMVLTEPLARRLFGDADPMGQVVRVRESYDCEVTGIVGQPPPGSLLQFSALLSLATELKENPGMTSGMIVHAFTTFLQLTPGAAPEAVAARIPGVVEAITGVPAAPATPAAGVSVQVVGKVGQGDLGPVQGKGKSKTHVFDGTPHAHPHPAAPESLQHQTSVVTLPVQGEGHLPPKALELPRPAAAGNPPPYVLQPHDHPHPASPESLQHQPSVITLPVQGDGPPKALELPQAASAGNPPPYVLQPLKSIYFDPELPNNLGKSGNSTYLVISALLAVVILTIAGVNYVNLATARAGRRIHEIGVRKALGAHRGQLIRQLLSESLLMSTAATVLGAALAAAMLQFIPNIAGSAFDLPSLDWSISTYAGAALLAAGVGVAAGAWPAWVVARMQPTAHLGGGRRGGARLRRGLVVTQFTATTALLTMTLLMWNQLDFTQDLLRENSILGADPEQVVVVRNRGLTVDQARAFKAELLQDSRIAAVSLSSALPGEGGRASHIVEGRMIEAYQVDAAFSEIMGLRMARGRALTDDPADARSLVINETAARVLGLEEPLGETILTWGDKRIVGVLEDFHFDGPRSEVGPLVMEQLYGSAGVTIVQVQPGHLDAALELIDEKWAAFAPWRPIRRHSLEEITARLYSEELRVGRALTLLLFLAIAVAAVGLFGMAAHAAHERTHEIGVRKVFGASAGGLTAMMLRDFARPVAIAFVLSVPLAWWLGNQWLHDFAYRVEMGAGLFVVSGALSFLIAGLTVGQQAIRASLTNPVETLRTE